jgi:hypothetical protein
VNPSDDLRHLGEQPSFLWLAVGCSGYADAPRLDPTADLLRQLQRLVSESVENEIAAAQRRKWVAERVMDAMSQLEPVLSTLKSILETLGGIPKFLADEVDSFKLMERKQAFEAVRCYAKILEGLEISPPPIVVVIDDATGATADLLETVTSLLFEPSEELGSGDAGNRYLPEVVDQVPPLPVIFVLSAWDHALFSGVETTPVARWLAEYEALGLQAETIDCREFDPTEAERMLERWPFGPPDDIRHTIVQHVASNNTKGLVNPLVLAEHVAVVEERRVPFSETIDVTPEYIEGLSTSPEHHIQERLEQLREADGGQEALALLGMLCAIAIRLPWGIVEALHAACGARTEVNRIRELLGGLGVATELGNGEIDPMTLFTIDADLFDYLKRNAGLGTDQLEALARGASDFFRSWITSFEVDSMLRGISDPWGPGRAALVSSFAQLGLAHLDREDDTAGLLAHALLDDPVELVDDQAGPRSALALAWLVSGCPEEVVTREILAGCGELGISRIGFACLKAVLEAREIASEAELLEPLLERLEGHTNLHYAEVMLVEVLCALREPDRVMSILAAEELSPQSVMILAKALTEADRREDALELLAACGDGDQQVVLRRANLIADAGDQEAALAVLKPHVEQWGVARQMCGLLSRLHRHRERGELLARWAARNPQAACMLAADLAGGDKEKEARTLLRAWGRSSLPAARQLALLEWSEGHYVAALTALAPFLHERESLQVRSAIAQMLDQVSRLGLRFRIDERGQLVPYEEKPSRGAVPAARPARSRVNARLDAAAIMGDIRSQLEEVPPHEIAHQLRDRYAHSPDQVQVLSEILRDQVRTTRDGEMAAVNYHFLALLPRRSAALACTIADMAFIAHLKEAKEAARSVLTPYAGSGLPAVGGRLVALEVLYGQEPQIDTIKKLERKERTFAFVAVFRMLAGNPDLEGSVWRALGEAGERHGDAELIRFVCIYASSRLLTLIRQHGPNPPSRRDLLRSLLPTIPSKTVIKTLEGVLHAFASNPGTVTPRLLPYQLVSMYESLHILGRADVDLERGLEKALTDELRATAQHIEAFLNWAEFSDLARHVAAALEDEQS